MQKLKIKIMRSKLNKIQEQSFFEALAWTNPQSKLQANIYVPTYLMMMMAQYFCKVGLQVQTIIKEEDMVTRSKIHAPGGAAAAAWNLEVWIFCDLKTRKKKLSNSFSVLHKIKLPLKLSLKLTEDSCNWWEIWNPTTKNNAGFFVVFSFLVVAFNYRHLKIIRSLMMIPRHST